MSQNLFVQLSSRKAVENSKKGREGVINELKYTRNTFIFLKFYTK